MSPRNRTKKLTDWKPNERGESSSSLPSPRVIRSALSEIPYLAMTNESFVPANKHRHNPVAIEMVFNVESYDASTNARYATSRPITKEYVPSCAKFQVNKLAIND